MASLGIAEFTNDVFKEAIALFADNNVNRVFGCVNAPDSVVEIVDEIQSVFPELVTEESKSYTYSYQSFKPVLDALLCFSIMCYGEEGIHYAVPKDLTELYEIIFQVECDIPISTQNAVYSNVNDYLEIIEIIKNGEYDEGDESEWEEIEEDGQEETEEVINLDEDEEEPTQEVTKEVHESVKSNEPDLSMWEDLLDTKTTAILQTYEDLYKSGYEGVTPDGLLVDDGMLVYNDRKIEHKRNGVLEFVFNLLRSDIPNVFNNIPHGNCKISMENIGKGYYYYPNNHLRSMFGLAETDEIKNYMKAKGLSKLNKYGDLSGYLAVEIKSTLKRCMVESGADLEKISVMELNKLLKPVENALQTVIIVCEYKPNVCLKLKICNGGNISFNNESIEASIKQNLGNTTELSSIISTGIVSTLTIVMNRDAYFNYPLFAFSILDTVRKQGKVDWGNVILGKRVDNDTIYRRSFKANTDFLICIIAGSRSGKGVMTLNILASAYASGLCPFYQDFKPDMGITMYDMARKYGVDTYAFDGSETYYNLKRPYDITKDAKNIPQGFIKGGLNKGTFVALVSYLRSIELLVRIAKLRQRAITNGRSVDDLGGEYLVCVFDEFQRFSTAYDTMFKKGGTLATIVQGITSTMKPAEKNSCKEFLYYNNLLAWSTTVLTRFADCMTATFGKAKCNIFMLWQNTDIENLGTPFGKLTSTIKTNSIRIVGNGTSSGNLSEILGSKKFSDEMKEYFQQYCFAIAKERGSVLSDDNTVMFKPYLLLNENTSQYVDELISRCKGFEEQVKNNITVNGQYIPEIGFDGYITSLIGTEEFTRLLGESYRVANKVVIDEGMGTDLLSFMYNVTDLSSKDIEFNPLECGDANALSDKYMNYGKNPYESSQQDAEKNKDKAVGYEAEEAPRFTQFDTNSTKGFCNTANSLGNVTRYQDNIFKYVNPELSEQSFATTKDIQESINMLSNVLLAHIIDTIGIERVRTFTEKDRYIIVNNVVIEPKIDDSLLSKIPVDIRGNISTGRWADVFMFGYTQHFPNIVSIEFTDIDYFYYKIALDYGIQNVNENNIGGSLRKLFKMHKSLSCIILGGEKVDRNFQVVPRNIDNDLSSSVRSREINDSLRERAPEQYKKRGIISNFYRNDKSMGSKVATTVGIGALAVIACTNPIGMIATGYLGGKVVIGGAKTFGRKVKGAFKAFGSAFKDSL